MTYGRLCRVVANVSQYAGIATLTLYLAIGTMLMTSKDPRVLISLLIIAPLSIVVVKVPGIVTLLSQNLSFSSVYVILYTMLSNFALQAMYATNPSLGVAICALNFVLTLWYVFKTDKYDKERLVLQCETPGFL